MAHAHRRLARHRRNASSTARTAGWQEIYRDGIAALGADFCTVDGDEQDRRLAAQPELRDVLYEHACEGAYGRARVRRQPRPRGLARHRLGRRRATARLHRRRGQRPCLSGRDCDAVVIGTGPAGATAADVLTSAGWSVIMLEKGRNHLLSLDAPFAGLGSRLERRDQVAAPPLPRARSVPRTAQLPARRGRRRSAVRGRGEQPAVDRRRRRVPRRRQAPALSGRRLQTRSRSSGRSRAPTSSTGPSTTTRWSRTTPKPNGSSAWPATPTATRSRNGAAARTRCRPAPTCSARC